MIKGKVQFDDDDLASAYKYLVIPLEESGYRDLSKAVSKKLRGYYLMKKLKSILLMQ